MAKKWEYKVVSLDYWDIKRQNYANKEELLNALAQKGWELVSMSGDEHASGEAYLRRELY